MNAQALLPFSGCQVGRLIRREKRFSMAVELAGRQVWAHTNNTGSMLGLLRPGLPVLLSPAVNPNRKLPWTVEAIGLPAGQGCCDWVGVNTSVPNRLLAAAFHAGLLSWAQGYSALRKEAVLGDSRLDGLLTGEGLPRLWVECKNVTLVEDDRAAFPDAVTERGSKHLRTLRDICRAGERAAMLYVVQRPDARCFGPADYIDPQYADELRMAVDGGVEAYVCVADVSEAGVFFAGWLPFSI